MKNLTKLLLLPVVLLYGLCFGEVHAEIFDNSHKFIAWGLANKNIPNTDENITTITGYSGMTYILHGLGGIKVSGQHPGFWCASFAKYNVYIDGSAISKTGFNQGNFVNDFQATPYSANFVAKSAICTLPSASDFPGVEIIVCNTSQNETITYKTVNNQTISGKQSGQLVNKVVNKVDKFISDGNNWYLE